MSKCHENVLEKISRILDVASALTAIQNQVEREGLLFFQIEKAVKNLRKSAVIWSSHFLENFRRLSQSQRNDLSEKEKSLLCAGIASPINHALTLIEKLSSMPDIRSLTQEILVLEQAQETLNDYLNHFEDLEINPTRSSTDAEELTALRLASAQKCGW